MSDMPSVAVVVFPAGTALPFGSMVRQLKRNQMLKDVTQAGGSWPVINYQSLAAVLGKAFAFVRQNQNKAVLRCCTPI
jgi:hypothetical protein